jgi:sugar/nucleoside kinase (ribokinase family)
MISFGTVFLELVFGRLARLPGPGEEIFTDEFAISCGGAVTSATAAAAAGLRAGVCTVLGDDVGSLVVTEHCAAVGVDTTTSARVERPAAGITVVLNFDGDRGFVTYLPPGRAGLLGEVERWRSVLRDRRPSWCYLHAGAAMVAFLRDARELGCKVMLDTSLGDERRYQKKIIECVRLADVFVPNADELVRLTGEASLEPAVSAARAWGTTLVVTRGAAGAIVADRDGSVCEVTRGVGQAVVRDLTGAGDHFAGAMIAALHGGASVREAAVAGNVAGSRAVALLGAVGDVAGGARTGADGPFRSKVFQAMTGALAGGSLADEMERGQ